MRTVPRLSFLAGVWLAAMVLAGCQDLRSYTGTWTGAVSGDPNLRQGFLAGSELTLQLDRVDRETFEGTVAVPGQPVPLRFSRIEQARADVLSEISLPGEPLRTYLGWLEPQGAPAYLAVVSLYGEDRIEVRIVRGPAETYGVFPLRRR